MAELDKVLKDIKNNKARGPEGINGSILNLNCIGNNLKQSLLILCNTLKNHGKVPGFMKKTVILTIPKPGSKCLLKNEQGIFVLNAVRNILMRIIYNSKKVI